MKTNRGSLLLALAPALALTGCDALSDLIRVEIAGTIQVDGTEPGSYSMQLYAQADNEEAFDTSFCEDGPSDDCFGRVDVDKLTTPAQSSDGGDLPVEFDGNSFVISDVPASLLYVLVVTGDDGTVQCSSDVVGFNENTKVVDSDNAITIGADTDIKTFDLPRPVRLQCSAVAEEPEAPSGGGGNGGDGDIPDGSGDDWSLFQITDKSGGTVYADATGGNTVADVVCDSSFPSVLNISAELADASATSAFLRIQFGEGASATYDTIEMPVIGGVIEQPFSLTGGYAVVQLDTDADANGTGESHKVTFCEGADKPAQEMLTILTWDKDDTDVDTHIYSAGSEVAYYSMSQSWGDLDIDDTNGYGPETFTSAPGTEGNLYDVKVHYYSDHGNGSTNVTMRVVYLDPSGEVCDVTSTTNMTSYGWWDVGVFGPGMACPN